MDSVSQGTGSWVRVEVVVMSCWKCGISFCVPQAWQKQRYEDGRRFWCPNGHGQWYGHDDDDTDDDGKSLAERQAKILKLHMEEQAEAKAAEKTQQTAELPKVGEAAPADEKLIAHADGYQIVCPKCDKGYRGPVWLANHLRKVHNIDVVKVGMEIVGDTSWLEEQ